MNAAAKQRLLWHCKLDELRLFYYDNATIYKKKTKQLHDK